MRIAIVGGGPAGLSLAKMMTDAGHKDIVVFEAEQRLGGKSCTRYTGSAVAELGTCYTTLSHRRVKRWVREKGLHLDRIGKMKFDGRDFLEYVNEGGGPGFPIQLLRFHLGGRRLLKQLSRPDPSRKALDEAAKPIGEWVRERNLPKVELFLHRMITLQGYGFLNETNALQAHRWCDSSLILSGALNQVHMIREGWSQFWEDLAFDFETRVSTPVVKIERKPDEISITTPEDQESFDHVVCAVPLDEFTSLCAPTPDEEFVNAHVDWQGYTTSLIASRNWFKDWNVEAYSDTVRAGAQPGMLLGARLEDHEEELGGYLYVTGQLSGTLTPAELKETAIADIERLGYEVSNFIEQKQWKYFPQYSSDGIRAGLVQIMRSMQGDNNTWYTGATFSHEAVSHITEFNRGLARQIAATARGKRQRPTP